MNTVELSIEARQVLFEILNCFSNEDEDNLEFEPAWLDFEASELEACKELEQHGFLEDVPIQLRPHQNNFSALVKKIN